jgi:hypothetical protein
MFKSYFVIYAKNVLKKVLAIWMFKPYLKGQTNKSILGDRLNKMCQNLKKGLENHFKYSNPRNLKSIWPKLSTHSKSILKNECFIYVFALLQQFLSKFNSWGFFGVKLWSWSAETFIYLKFCSWIYKQTILKVQSHTGGITALATMPGWLKLSIISFAQCF